MKNLYYAVVLTSILSLGAFAQTGMKSCCKADGKCCTTKTKCCASKTCCCGKHEACCKDMKKCMDPKKGCCTKCCDKKK